MTTGRSGLVGLQQAIVVVDYPGRREGARVADLRLEQHGYVVVDLLREMLPAEVEARRYAEKLYTQCAHLSVNAVIAYCQAGPIGQELAYLLTHGNHHPPGLILLDCRPATLVALEDSYRTAALALGGRSEDAAAIFRGFHRRSGEAVVDAMRGDLLAHAVSLLVDDGEYLDEPARRVAEQLVDRYMCWLVHLLAALTSRLPSWGGDVLHVVSSDHPYEADWPGARTTRTVRMPCSRNDLLGDERTQAAVLSWLKDDLTIRRTRQGP